MCEELLHILQERGETAAIRTMMVPPADTLSSPRSLSSRRASSRWRKRLRRAQDRKWWLGGIAALLLSSVVLARELRNDQAAAAQPGLVGDTTGRVASTTSDTGPRPVQQPPKPRLVVQAPPRVDVLIDGQRVGTGLFQTDSLRPGTYRLTASVGGQSGCPSTTVSDTVTLGDSGTRNITLTPRRCGTVMIRGRPDGATYTIRSFSGDANRTGSLPLAQPLLLPAGPYRLTVQARFCAQFTQEFRIEADRDLQLPRIALIC
jgi:hypothetical protein